MKAFVKGVAVATTPFFFKSLHTQAFTSSTPILSRQTATRSPLFVASHSSSVNNNMLPLSQNSHHPVRSMMRGWLSMMVPMAWTCWRRTASLPATVGAFFFAPLFAIAQGTIGIVRYRVLYGDAPLPHSPAHGVVVVNPNSTSTISTSCGDEQHITGCACLGGRRWRNTTQLSENDSLVLKRALDESPLRLLVIGDSLAIGVGTSASCTPLLPEVIARTLSKAYGGRAVYWTCHGEPGASAGWIVRELERKSSQPPLSRSETESSLSDESSSSDEAEPLPKEWQEWRDRLHTHKKRFHPDVLGPYDVCVVLTGSNDLKSAFFPFLLSGDDVLFRREAKERGGSYANELRRVLDVLQRRMKEGMEDFKENILERTENILERLQPNSPRTRLYSKDATNIATTGKKLPHQQKRSGPLIVLPGMAARALPIFRTIPLRWLAVPIVDIMDNHKRALAESHPGEVMFVEAPTIETISEFEEQRGAIWKQREQEDTLLALRDVDRGTCVKIEAHMKEYYERKGQAHSSSKPNPPQHNAPVPPLSERPGTPGSKIFSVDSVHPNDEGYDFWGRYIATAIVGELKRKEIR